MIHSLVILDRHLEIVLRRGLLQHGVSLVLKLLARAVPIHHKAADVQVLGADNLLLEHRRIVAGITHGNVRAIAKPRLVDGQKHRAGRRMHGSERTWGMPCAAGQAR